MQAKKKFVPLHLSLPKTQKQQNPSPASDPEAATQ